MRDLSDGKQLLLQQGHLPDRAVYRRAAVSTSAIATASAVTTASGAASIAIPTTFVTLAASCGKPVRQRLH